jgi:hypothetical protein
LTDALGRDELVELEARVDEWLAELASAHDHIVAIDRSPDDELRWFVRMRGEEKDFTTVWLTLGQRTLRYETYVMPAPEENAEALYEQELRRNDKPNGAHFSIGVEDALFLRGETPAATLSIDAVDRALGTLYAQVEQCFRALLHIGFASRFAP